jgi:hypothetical protein
MSARNPKKKKKKKKRKRKRRMSAGESDGLTFALF